MLLIPMGSSQTTDDTIFDTEDQTRGSGVVFTKNTGGFAAGSSMSYTDPSGDTTTYTTNTAFSSVTVSFAEDWGTNWALVTPSQSDVTKVKPLDGTWQFTYSVTGTGAADNCSLTFTTVKQNGLDKTLVLNFGTCTTETFSGSFTWNIHLAPTSETVNAALGPPDSSDGEHFDPTLFRNFITEQPPEGLLATVTNPTSTPKEIDLELAISPDDPLSAAQGTYAIERDSGSGFTQIATLPGGDASNRQFSYQDTITGTGTVTYRVRLFYEVSSGAGEYLGPYSCTVTVTRETLGSSDGCGELQPAPQGGELFGPTGVLYGGDKTGLADALQISETALDGIYSLIWILVFSGAAFLATKGNLLATTAGGILGVAFSLTFGLIPIWLVLFIITIAAAGLLFTRGRVRSSG